eukprot:7413_1
MAPLTSNYCMFTVDIVYYMSQLHGTLHISMDKRTNSATSHNEEANVQLGFWIRIRAQYVNNAFKSVKRTIMQTMNIDEHVLSVLMKHAQYQIMVLENTESME